MDSDRLHIYRRAPKLPFELGQKYMDFWSMFGYVYEEIDRQQEQFKKLQSSLTDIIMTRCNKDPSERKKIVASWRDCVWLNAKESLEYGIVDSIMSPEEYQSLFYKNIVKP